MIMLIFSIILVDILLYKDTKGVDYNPLILPKKDAEITKKSTTTF